VLLSEMVCSDECCWCSIDPSSRLIALVL